MNIFNTQTGPEMTAGEGKSRVYCQALVPNAQRMPIIATGFWSVKSEIRAISRRPVESRISHCTYPKPGKLTGVFATIHCAIVRTRKKKGDRTRT
jgi:hypothetical protein